MEKREGVEILSNAWKVYMLAVVSFLVGTSEFIIAGILDKIAEDTGVSVSAAGQPLLYFHWLMRSVPLS